MGLVIKPRRVPPAYLTSEFARSTARAALRSGEYTSVRRGAVVPAFERGDHWADEEARLLAAIASVERKLTNGAVFSHVSAALLHGLWVRRLPDKPQVTQRYKPNSHGSATLRRHCAELPAEDVTTLGALRVTTIERTIVDCARTMHPRDALVIADSGMRALIGADRRTRVEDAPRVAALRSRLLDMVGQGPGHGRRRARAVIEAADPYSESPMETELRWIAVSRGLPAPTAQLEVLTRGGTFYVDLGWRWRVRRPDGTVVVLTLVAEYDGEVKYLPDGGLVADATEAARAVLAEKQREDLIREVPGTAMLRFSRGELRDPDAVLARLLAAFPPEVRPELQPVHDLLVGPRPRS